MTWKLRDTQAVLHYIEEKATKSDAQMFGQLAEAPVTFTIVKGEGFFSDGTMTTNLGTTYTATSSSYYFTVVPTSSKEILIAYDMAKLKTWVASTNYRQALRYFTGHTQIEHIECWSGYFSGDIQYLSGLTKMNQLILADSPQVSGEISSLSAMTALTTLNLANTQVSGDIQTIIDNCTKLTSLSIPRTVTITDAQKQTLTDRGCTVSQW